MRHLRQKIVGIIPIIQMIIGAGGSLDAKDRLERRMIDIAIVHTRMENTRCSRKIQKIRFQKSRMGEVVDDEVSIFDSGGL